MKTALCPALLAVTLHGAALAQPQIPPPPAGAVPASAPAAALSQGEALRRFSSSSTEHPPPPWRAVGLPGARKPLPSFDVVPLDGQRVLRVLSDSAYGHLLHELPSLEVTAATRLRWRWRVDEVVGTADPRDRATDDEPVKVCALFDMPLDRLRFWERNLLRLMRSQAHENLPAATLCYIWDARLPPGTLLPNAYTSRVRFIVVGGGASSLGHWQPFDQPLARDFMRAFGDETPVVPPLIGVSVGADSDNTRGRSLAHVSDIELRP